MASKKAARKGKRYSPEEKKEVVDFVNRHNAEKGRGGASAASRKFGVSQLTVASWLKGGSQAGNSPASARAFGSSDGKRAKVLAELSKLDGVIAARRRELDALEARFQKLKASL
jgi:transposase-like protein